MYIAHSFLFLIDIIFYVIALFYFFVYIFYFYILISRVIVQRHSTIDIFIKKWKKLCIYHIISQSLELSCIIRVLSIEFISNSISLVITDIR